jgi:hypothetical protein
MMRLPPATDGQRPTIGCLKFPNDTYAMLHVDADEPVHAWHEDEPIVLSRANDSSWYVGTFAVPRDADQAKLLVEIGDVRHNLVVRFKSEPEPAEPVEPAPVLKLRRRGVVSSIVPIVKGPPWVQISRWIGVARATR